ADAPAPRHAVAAPKAAAPFLRPAGGDEDVLPAPHGSRQVRAVGGHAAERLAEPPERADGVHSAVHHPVREVVQTVVEGDPEHAHGEGERTPMVADDQRRAPPVEVLEALDAVPMVALCQAPGAHPEWQEAFRPGSHPPTWTRIAPCETPAPTPAMRMRSPGET